MQPMRDDAFNYENTNSESFSLLLDYDYQPNRPDQARPNQAKPGQARPSIHRIARSTSRNRGNFIYAVYKRICFNDFVTISGFAAAICSSATTVITA